MRKIDLNRLKIALNEAERFGSLRTQHELWEATAAVYNADLDDLGPVRPGGEISPMTVYHAVKNLNIDVKTRPAKSGRPNQGKGSLQAETLKALETSAVEAGWRRDDERWELINRNREAMGLDPVNPVSRPKASHFKRN